MSESLSDSSSVNTTNDGHLVLLFLFLALSTGIILRYLFTSRLHVSLPYTSVLLITSVLLGLAQLSGTANSTLGLAEDVMVATNPNLIQYIFTPILILEMALHIHYREVKRLFTVILLLVIPGVICTSLLTTVLVYYGLTGYDWDWITCLMFGSILVATDTAVVTEAMKRMGVAERLSQLIEGESMLVDGLAFILFTLFREMVFTSGSSSVIPSDEPANGSINVGQEIGAFAQDLLGGPAFGLAIGICVIFFLYRVISDPRIEITVTILGAFVTYYVGSYHLAVSGNMGTVAYGLYVGQWLRHTISPEVLPSLEHAVEVLAYVAHTLVFFIAGVIAAYYMFVSSSIGSQDVGYCFLLWFFLLLTRAFAVILLLPFIRLLGYKLRWKDVIMISWSGIRGSQCLILSLLAVLNGELLSSVTHRIGFQVSGIVILTTLINGTTVPLLVRLLRLGPDSNEGRLVLQSTVKQMHKEVNEQIEQMKQTKDFEAARWTEVQSLTQQNFTKALGKTEMQPERQSHFTSFITKWTKYIGDADDRILNSDTGSASPSDSTSPSSSSVPFSSAHDSGGGSLRQRNDLIERYLEIQRTEYDHLYDGGCLSRAAVTVLLRSIGYSVDRRDLGAQWSVIESAIRVPRWMLLLYESSHSRRIPLLNQWINRQIFLHFCLTVELTAAFCKSHLRLKRFLNTYPVLDAVNVQVMQDIREEASVYHNRARAAFQDIRRAFPHVYSSVHSKYASITLLLHEQSALSRYHENGLLTDLEYHRLSETIHSSIITFKRTPIENTMPSPEQVLLTQDYTKHLTSEQQQWLLAEADRKLLQPNTMIGEVMDNKDALYIIVRGQMAIYYQAEAAAAAVTSQNSRKHSNDSLHTNSWQCQGIEVFSVNNSLSNTPGDYGAVVPQSAYDASRSFTVRVSTGRVIGAGSVLLSVPQLSSVKTVTTCEVWYLPGQSARRVLSDCVFSECLWRFAADDLLKGNFSHIHPYHTFNADVLTLLLARAKFHYTDDTHTTQTHEHEADGHDKHLAHAWKPDLDTRVLLLQGEAELVLSAVGTSTRKRIPAPALIHFHLTNHVASFLSSQAIYLVWKELDEQEALRAGLELKPRRNSLLEDDERVQAEKKEHNVDNETEKDQSQTHDEQLAHSPSSVSPEALTAILTEFPWSTANAHSAYNDEIMDLASTGSQIADDDDHVTNIYVDNLAAQERAIEMIDR